MDVDGLVRRLKEVLRDPGQERQTPPWERPIVRVDTGTRSCPFGLPGQCEERALVPGDGQKEWFKDLDVGPEMVVVPAGKFVMGSPETEPERDEPKGAAAREDQFTVTIPYPFAVGRFTVTRGEFASFVRATGYQTPDEVFILKDDNFEPAKGSWREPGFAQDDNHPVVCINWFDAKAYVAWLTEATGKPYRLLSEAEWEYVCRAGSITPFWWGTAVSPDNANYRASYVYAGGGRAGEWKRRTLPVDSFAPNPWGLFQLHGNVWEQCEDLWNDALLEAPRDGLPSATGDPARRVLRGGSWYNYPWSLRSAHRHGCYTYGRVSAFGFRVARTLNTLIPQ
jgi:formylglycine-generating enzyme required for sulfatase activity